MFRSASTSTTPAIPTTTTTTTTSTTRSHLATRNNEQSNQTNTFITTFVATSAVALAAYGIYKYLQKQKLYKQLPPSFKYTDSTRNLFRKYSQYIGKSTPSDEEILNRIISLKDELKAVFPYRCIEAGQFAVPRITMHPYYEILKPKMAKIRYLDIGVCVGTDVRQCIVDGLNPKNAFGIDLNAEFFRLGQRLFDDADSNVINQVHFKEGSALTFASDPVVRAFADKGGIDVIYAGSLLHLLTEEEIEQFIDNCFKVLSNGGVVIGRTSGSSHPLSPVTIMKRGKPQFLHSRATLTQAFAKYHFQDIEIVVSDKPSVLSKDQVENEEVEKQEEAFNQLPGTPFHHTHKSEDELASAWSGVGNTSMLSFTAKKPLA